MTTDTPTNVQEKAEQYGLNPDKVLSLNTSIRVQHIYAPANGGSTYQADAPLRPEDTPVLRRTVTTYTFIIEGATAPVVVVEVPLDADGEPAWEDLA